MHDPMTVAFEIKYPWWRHRPWPKAKRHVAGSYEDAWNRLTAAERARCDRSWREGYRDTFLTIWHRDPCKDGTDDSCGRFIRARHADPATLARVVAAFAFDWDRTFQLDRRDGQGREQILAMGFFTPDGQPNFSVAGVALNLFFLAALEVFDRDRRRAMRYVQDHLAEILIFAENPTDSLATGFTRKFEVGCGEVQDERSRKERIERVAACIYTWILRDLRPWYRHPRWHVHHFVFQLHPLQHLRRRYWDRCCRCGKRGFPPGVSAIGNWAGTEVWHSTCDPGAAPGQPVPATPADPATP